MTATLILVLALSVVIGLSLGVLGGGGSILTDNKTDATSSVSCCFHGLAPPLGAKPMGAGKSPSE